MKLIFLKKQTYKKGPPNGVLNVWVKTVGKQDDHPVIKSADAKVTLYWWAQNNKNMWWAGDNKHILYWKDKDGDENYHISRIDLATGQVVDLTPFDGVRVFLYASSTQSPNELLIGMNKENKLHHLRVFNPCFFSIYNSNKP